jgi:hypothetical protein
MAFDPRQHLIQLKGKDYLPVATRLVWLNEEAERYSIRTEILRLEETHAVVQATVTVSGKDEKVLKTATALKREDKTHFQDFLEKAETGAVGRALGMLGYGTQFAPEFDETSDKGEARVVDSPQPLPAATAKPAPAAAANPALSAMGLKPASSLSAPTNKRKPQAEPETPAPTKASVAQAEEPDIDDGLEEYDHGSVPDDDLFSDAKVARLLEIGAKLFNLKGDALETRVLGAAGKILGKSVADIHALHWRDGSEVMKQLEETAIKRGVWQRNA